MIVLHVFKRIFLPTEIGDDRHRKKSRKTVMNSVQSFFLVREFIVEKKR